MHSVFLTSSSGYDQNIDPTQWNVINVLSKYKLLALNLQHIANIALEAHD